MIVLFVTSLYVISACSSKPSINHETELYSGFQNPPAEARPFVRWWWNDNKVEATELDRELELLKSVGFGGVEINPIASNAASVEIGKEALVWMSDEWIDMLVHACKKSKDLGMITDMIVGTGWPFGGEFLSHDETCQRIMSHYLPYSGNSTIKLSKDDLLNDMINHYENEGSRKHQSEKTTYELFYIYLVPLNCKNTGQAIDLKQYLNETGSLSYKIELPGEYHLCYGFREQSFRKVSSGAIGGAGPVMDHYNKEVTYQYLARLKRISEKTGIPLDELIRALFCDSIEISGANWTDEFGDTFLKKYSYSLDIWLPFIFYPAYSGYEKDEYDNEYDSQFKDQLKRVRYDYNRLLVETFLENFTRVFQDFCTENNLLCRYQAYGTPFLMGMLDGYMIPDIPESNNWIYSRVFDKDNMKDSVWTWNQGHGYMIWNMMAASGGHLSGRKIISCEAMTNTAGVFRTTLEEIKQHDDMNFITGINHSVLHGFNYSPIEAGFPGWLKYGAFFSEHNTWWEHLPEWVDYNARLSYVFQNSQADKSIAIVGPTSDLWGDVGLTREDFHLTPQYLYKLWEPISQLGYSNDYINEKIVQGADFHDGLMQYGNMKYELLVLASLKSIDPKTALAIERYLKSGGKVVVIDHLPVQSLHYTDYEKNDEMVKALMESLSEKYPQSFLQIDGPTQNQRLFTWTRDMLAQTGVYPDVLIDRPCEYVYQIHQYTEDEELYFFNNSHRYNSAEFKAVFPVEGKYPWIWNPETGERKPCAYKSDPEELEIVLKPLESLLIVFEDEKPKTLATLVKTERKELEVLENAWDVEGKRVDGEIFNWKMDELIDFSQSEDVNQNTFGGKIIYTASISTPKGVSHIDLGDVNEGITELYVNGKNAGTSWYGLAIFPVADFLKEGENEIEIRYTTVLANYCRSLKDNKTAQHWTSHNAIAPTGMEGPVKLVAY